MRGDLKGIDKTTANLPRAPMRRAVDQNVMNAFAKQGFERDAALNMMAETLGWTRQTIEDKKNGIKKGFNLKEIESIAALLQVPVSKLLDTKEVQDVGIDRNAPKPELTVQRIIDIAQKNGVMKKQLACFAKVSTTTIFKTLNGSRTPKVDEVRTLANGLGVRAEYLLGEDDNPIRAPHTKKVSEGVATDEQTELDLEDSPAPEKASGFTEADRMLVDRWASATKSVLNQKYDEPDTKAYIVLFPVYAFVNGILESKDTAMGYRLLDWIGQMLQELAEEFMEETK